LGGAFDITGKPGATDDFAMMDGCFIIGADDGDTISFSNLPASLASSGFTVNFHTTHADTRICTFTINGVSANTQQPDTNTFGGDFTGYTAAIPVAPGTSAFTVTFSANAGNPNRLNLAGISFTPPQPQTLTASSAGFWDEIDWTGNSGAISGDLPETDAILIGQHREVIYRGIPASETVSGLNLGQNSVFPGQGSLRVQSGQLGVSGSLYVGRNGVSADGSLIIAGGGFEVGGNLEMGSFNFGGSMIRLHNPGSGPAIEVDGTLRLDRCSLDLTFDASYVHTPGNIITVANYGSRTGQFLNFRDGEEFNCGPHRFRIAYDATPGAITLTALPNWPASVSRPHIVLLFADDQGVSDLSIQGDPKFPMPRLDSMVSAGVRFTDSYVTGGVCHPSRCGLLTGRYQHR
jgi:hypothetical protein